MNDSFKLAMQLTMIDMLSGVAQVAKRNILAMGSAGKEVQRDFDLMTHHIGRGLKSIAVANYGFEKIRPGIAAAADLQENLIDVRMSLMRSGQAASTLGKELAQVRSTAVDLQKITPFSASDVVQVQKELLNSGLEFDSVIGKGATRAAMMLATITKEAPSAAAAAMLNIGIPYHLKSSEYGDVADVIQKHVMSGRMKLPDLNAALPYVAPVAKQFKVPWDDLLTGMAVLGEQGQLGSMAGTHLKDFYSRLTGSSRISRRIMGAVNRDLVGKGHAPLEFWDKKGEMLPTQQLIKNLRSSMGNYNTKQRMFILEKIFGEQGGLAAMGLMSEGTGSWEFVKKKVLDVAGAEEKMTERLKGFNASLTALKGTSTTSLASLFNPMLSPLTQAADLMNTLVAGAGKLADAHPAVTAVGNGIIGTAIVSAGAYGAYNLIKGGAAGARVLKGLRGFGGSALGIAEGKAVQAATGVQPVFVTNWPGGALPGVVESAGVTGASLAAKALPWAAIAGGSAAAIALAGIPISRSISHAARENGWGTQTILHNSREYDVMGISGRKNTKNNIHIDMKIDGNGRVISSTDNMDTSIKTMPRGSFFAGIPAVR
ncbi:MAG: phage tail tape measure protein [Geobacteraceae bacterium]|nr:phage tail tape measure protein [Geobacteraceae bacterium]